MRPHRGALGAALLSLVALVAVRAGSGGGPPLYDGICVPHNYLMLGGNPAPAPAAKALQVTQDFPVTQVATPDLQAQLILASGSFTVPPGSTVTVTVTPVPPPAVKPDGPLDGNAYQFAAEGPGGQPLTLNPAHPATVVLQATAARSGLVVEHFDGTGWTALKSFQSGCGDTEEAASPTLGLFALVAKGAAVAPGGGATNATGGGISPVIIALVAAVVLLAAVIGMARLSRRQRR